MRRAQSYIRRASSYTTVVLPGEYLELDVPSDPGHDRVLAILPRTHTQISNRIKPACVWPEPKIKEAVRSKMRVINTSLEPKSIRAMNT